MSGFSWAHSRQDWRAAQSWRWQTWLNWWNCHYRVGGRWWGARARERERKRLRAREHILSALLVFCTLFSPGQHTRSILAFQILACGCAEWQEVFPGHSLTFFWTSVCMSALEQIISPSWRRTLKDRSKFIKIGFRNFGPSFTSVYRSSPTLRRRALRFRYVATCKKEANGARNMIARGETQV